jgi:hypothetical protein
MKVPSPSLSQRFISRRGLLIGATTAIGVVAAELAPCFEKIPESRTIVPSQNLKKIDSLREVAYETDLKQQEINWVNEVWPIIKPLLIEIYEAEKKDAEDLKAHRITEKDRRVKICFTDFAPNKRARDRGEKLRLHVVKKYKDIQVNEHWPVDPSNGNIIYPDVIRIRAGQENLTDALGLIWIDDGGGTSWDIDSSGEKKYTPVYPKFYRQHMWGYDFKEQEDKEGIERKNQRKNLLNQLRINISNPISCVDCHTPGTALNLSRNLFLDENPIRYSETSITPFSEFEKLYNEQLGFKHYKSFLKDLKISQKKKDELLKGLQNTSHLENPGIIVALKDDNIPWVGKDVEVKAGYSSDPSFYRYKFKGREFIQSGYLQHKIESFTWWSPEEAIAIGN